MPRSHEEYFDEQAFSGEARGRVSILEIGEKFGVRLPESYIELMRWAGGGTYRIGENKLHLWGVDRVLDLNDEYEIQRWMPDIVGIGTNKGGECYALDYSGQPAEPRFVFVPLGDLEREAIVVIGATLLEGLANMRHRNLTPD